MFSKKRTPKQDKIKIVLLGPPLVEHVSGVVDSRLKPLVEMPYPTLEVPSIHLESKW